jgi:hypothetical protein
MKVRVVGDESSLLHSCNEEGKENMHLGAPLPKTGSVRNHPSMTKQQSIERLHKIEKQTQNPLKMKCITCLRRMSG